MFDQSIPAQNIILRTLPADVVSALQPALSRLAPKRRQALLIQNTHAQLSLPTERAAPSCGASKHRFGENEHAAESLSRVGA